MDIIDKFWSFVNMKRKSNGYRLTMFIDTSSSDYAKRIVLQSLNELDTNVLVGPGRIRATFLKGCASFLASPLRSDYFHLCWKTSFVKQIFKSGQLSP